MKLYKISELVVFFCYKLTSIKTIFLLMKMSIKIRPVLNHLLFLADLLTRLHCKLKVTIEPTKKYVHKEISNVFVLKAVYNWNKMNLIVIRVAWDIVARSFRRSGSRWSFYRLTWFLHLKREKIFLETSKRRTNYNEVTVLRSSAIDRRIYCSIILRENSRIVIPRTDRTFRFQLEINHRQLRRLTLIDISGAICRSHELSALEQLHSIEHRVGTIFSSCTRAIINFHLKRRDELDCIT